MQGMSNCCNKETKGLLPDRFLVNSWAWVLNGFQFIKAKANDLYPHPHPTSSVQHNPFLQTVNSQVSVVYLLCKACKFHYYLFTHKHTNVLLWLHCPVCWPLSLLPCWLVTHYSWSSKQRVWTATSVADDSFVFVLLVFIAAQDLLLSHFPVSD